MFSPHHYHMSLIAGIVLSVNSLMAQDQLPLPKSQAIHLHSSDTPSSRQKHPQTNRMTSGPQEVSIADLLTNTQKYHQQLVTVHGVITQPELHLDETELFIDFVFRLSHGEHSIVVYGRHDRTQGVSPITTNHSVEVIGTFWKEQERKGMTISNAIEALSVMPSPPSTPSST